MAGGSTPAGFHSDPRDESIYGPVDALAIVRAEAADALSIYVGKAAGIGPAHKISGIAEAAMLGSTIGSNLELGIVQRP
jgi:muconate cycloisomerase